MQSGESSAARGTAGGGRLVWVRSVLVGRDYLAPLRRDHKHDHPRRSALREEPDGPVGQKEVGPAGVEAVHPPALEVATVDQARPDRHVRTGQVAVLAGAVGPVLAVERVPPAGPGVDTLRDDLPAGVVDVGTAG